MNQIICNMYTRGEFPIFSHLQILGEFFVSVRPAPKIENISQILIYFLVLLHIANATDFFSSISTTFYLKILLTLSHLSTFVLQKPPSDI